MSHVYANDPPGGTASSPAQAVGAYNCIELLFTIRSGGVVASCF